MPFNSDVPLFVFCPDDLSDEESGVLKSSVINGLMLVHVFNHTSTFL